MKNFYIIDAYSQIYKSYYAIRNLKRRDGLFTNAVYGFIRTVMKIVREHEPDYLVIAFDSKKPSFRKEVYADYKANRPPMPEDLQAQIPYIKKVIDAFKIQSIEFPGYEADDLIGYLSTRYSGDHNVYIVSSDKDLFQLINDRVKVVDVQKEKEYTPKEVEQKFQVPPEKITELFGLIGDSSDNIPGVRGVGPKTGAKLLNKYGSLRNLYEHIEEVKGKLQEKLKEDRENAFLSKSLATIKTDLEIDLDIEDFDPEDIKEDELESLLKELEFSSLLNEWFPDRTGFKGDYDYIDSEDEFDEFIDLLSQSGRICIDLETTGIDPVSAEIVGIGISNRARFGRYIPINHRTGVQLPEELVLNKLKPVLENSEIKKVGHNLKYEYMIFKRYGIILSGLEMDTSIAAYLLNPNNNRTNLDYVSLEYLNLKKTPITNLIGEKKKAQCCFSEVEIESAYHYACEDVDAPLRLCEVFMEKLNELDLAKLNNEMEVPLVTVLGEMELNGVKLDRSHLDYLELQLNDDLAGLTSDIYKLAGEEFNINSPKQLAEILFEKMKLPPKRKTKTGYSTDFEVLTELSGEHKIAEYLVEYRKLTKLLNTYVTSLKDLINPDTHLIHTSFNQTITATGRLSSSNPNLQNIPIKSEEGKKIREAFISRWDDGVILSADYSQIELRFLAHFSKDPELVTAFENNEDIHTRTASLIFDMMPGLVGPEERRIAKKVNYGIIYGQTPYGLSRELGITPGRAKKFIDNYFDKYKNVNDYVRQVIDTAYTDGFIRTISGRLRHIPELRSKNKNQRSFGERIAMNTPLQGSAADLIKKALIDIFKELNQNDLNTKLILQVHDELVFDVPQKEIDIITKLVKDKMEHAMELNVPVIVDINHGANWAEAH